jgi:hypothetical protein
MMSQTTLQEGHMSRNKILAAGALLWSVFAVDAALHVANGDWMAPAVAGLVAAVWVTNRRVKRALTFARPVTATRR